MGERVGRETFYRGRGGRCYHRYPECNGLNAAAMNREVVAVSRPEATRIGLDPCKLCQPAPLLRAVFGDR